MVEEFNQVGDCDKCNEEKSNCIQEGVFILCEPCWNRVNEFIVFDQRNIN